MKINKTVSRITAFLHRNISKDVLDALKEVKVQDLHLSSARSLVIEVKKGLTNILDYMPFEMNIKNYRKEIRKHFIYIGFLENFKDSVYNIAGKLGFQHVKLEHLNPSNQFQHVSTKLKREFIESHEIEYAIYNYVVQNNKTW